MALQLTDEQLDWLAERIPDPPKSAVGGRPPMDKRKAIRGIFWMLDNGAKWKDLPGRFGSKSTVHRWFKTWTQAGVFEDVMREAGRWNRRFRATPMSFSTAPQFLFSDPPTRTSIQPESRGTMLLVRLGDLRERGLHYGRGACSIRPGRR